MLNDRTRRHSPLGEFQRVFFYVPKGTRQLQYFCSGAAHKVFGPNGAVIDEVKAGDEIVTIAVPAGLDGQCWSFSRHGHAQLWLINAPNALAAMPNGLLLPRELVARDNLRVPSER